MRGLAKVRAEFSLIALAYKLRRALNILGVEAMKPETSPTTAGSSAALRAVSASTCISSAMARRRAA